MTNALESARILRQKTRGAQPVFSLRHLAHLVGVEYSRLRGVTSRKEEPYRVFRIRKRPLPEEADRFRTIVVPANWLMTLQQWVNINILDFVAPHDASMAFSKGDSIREAAAAHCSSQWLIKIDIRNFFESITERQVYYVFKSIGYQPLVAFELARLCTRVGDRRARLSYLRYQSDSPSSLPITSYHSAIMGHLPQGAPTSPRIANLVAKDLDICLTAIANEHGLTYTRYADDLIFSTKDKALDRAAARTLVGEIYKTIAANGFQPNTAKTVVSPPGARKVVLGLLVDRETPRLTREFKATLRQHLYYLRRDGIGPSGHTSRCGGATIHGLQRHILGLIQHARQIERAYGDARLVEFNEVDW